MSKKNAYTQNRLYNKFFFKFTSPVFFNKEGNEIYQFGHKWLMRWFARRETFIVRTVEDYYKNRRLYDRYIYPYNIWTIIPLFL